MYLVTAYFRGGARRRCRRFELIEGLAEFGLRVHDDGAVPGDWLLKRPTGDEQEADAFGAGIDGDFVASVEEHQQLTDYPASGAALMPCAVSVGTA